MALDNPFPTLSGAKKASKAPAKTVSNSTGKMNTLDRVKQATGKSQPTVETSTPRTVGKNWEWVDKSKHPGNALFDGTPKPVEGARVKKPNVRAIPLDETIAKAREAEIAKETKKQEVREVKRSERMMRVAYDKRTGFEKDVMDMLEEYDEENMSTLEFLEPLELCYHLEVSKTIPENLRAKVYDHHEVERVTERNDILGKMGYSTSSAPKVDESMTRSQPKAVATAGRNKRVVPVEESDEDELLLSPGKKQKTNDCTSSAPLKGNFNYNKLPPSSPPPPSSPSLAISSLSKPAAKTSTLTNTRHSTKPRYPPPTSSSSPGSGPVTSSASSRTPTDAPSKVATTTANSNKKSSHSRAKENIPPATSEADSNSTGESDNEVRKVYRLHPEVSGRKDVPKEVVNKEAEVEADDAEGEGEGDEDGDEGDADDRSADKPRKSRKAKKRLNEFHPDVADCIQRAKHDFAAMMGADTMYPTTVERGVMIAGAWEASNEHWFPDQPPFEFDKVVQGLIKEEESRFRGAVRDRVRKVIPLYYGFKPGRSGEVTRINGKRHTRLRCNGAFLCKNIPDSSKDSATGYYEHPILQFAFNEAFYRDDKDLGPKFGYMDPIVPVAAMAFVITVVEFCLDEWKEGQFVSLTFEGSYYQLKYRGHKKSLTRFAEVSNPNTWRRISQELLRAAKDNAGIEPEDEQEQPEDATLDGFDFGPDEAPDGALDGMDLQDIDMGYVSQEEPVEELHDPDTDEELQRIRGTHVGEEQEAQDEEDEETGEERDEEGE